ncbi:hypothetical protein, partial [Methanosarcina sp.]|uniref:hypothetical protein n=1 Tax=Methanosarcina sp. TaxID=2213 RepID=UPI002ABC088F
VKSICFCHSEVSLIGTTETIYVSFIPNLYFPIYLLKSQTTHKKELSGLLRDKLTKSEEVLQYKNSVEIEKSRLKLQKKYGQGKQLVK